MSTELTEHRGSELAGAIEQKGLGDILKPLIREIHLFDTFVSGTTRLKDPTVLDSVRVGDAITLRREDNKFDSNAIVLLTEDGRKLGYVPEKDDLIFARLMDAGKMLAAKIKDIDRKGSFTQITIGIFMVDF